MFIKFKSNHPEFLSLLSKNPDTFSGLQLREIKNGVAVGQVVSPSEYNITFFDTKYSFSEDMSNQIDFQSFCNPRAFLAISGIYLRHLLVEQSAWFSDKIPWLNTTIEDLDTCGYVHTIEVQNVYADNLHRNREFVLSKYFPEVKLTHKLGNLYSLEINSNKTLHYTINLVNLVMMYLSAVNTQPWFLTDDLSAKYIRIMKNLEPVPYFVIYLFARSCLKTEASFNRFKTDLESAYGGELQMVWGNTQEMRLEAVRANLLVDTEINEHVIEVGCGELDYPRRFLKRLKPGFQWWALDLNDYGHLAERLNERYQTDALHFAHNSTEVPDDIKDNVTLVMVEVIEHMSEIEAIDLVSGLLDERNPKKAIITTPNRNFNKHFGLDGKFRHDDHEFEFTPDEFITFINFIIVNRPFTVEFFGIGDKIGTDHISLGAKLIRKEIGE